MVAVMMMQQQQQQHQNNQEGNNNPPPPAPTAAAPINNNNNNIRNTQFQNQYINLLNPPPPSSHHHNIDIIPSRVRLIDILPYDGSPTLTYTRSIESLSNSLIRHNAAIIQLSPQDSSLFRCALDSSRLFFRTRKDASTRGGGGLLYTYRAAAAGTTSHVEDPDSSPPCMPDIFRCMGKAARASLCAIARHLRLRSDFFNHLLDDSPLPCNEASSSVLVASFSNMSSSQQGKCAIGGGKPVLSFEVEKGLLMLISSDTPGLQVCDPNGHWYRADDCLAPGELLLLTGKALSHATAGLRPAASYRVVHDNTTMNAGGGVGRTSLAFRLMPQGNAILDCSPIAAAGHIIPQSYSPISVSQFMDDLTAEEDILGNHTDNASVPADNLNREPSLRSVLSDPLSGAFLEDAMLVSCGHSFGGLMLRKVIETSRCMLCNSEIEAGSLIPNHALRAAAMAVKQEDDRRLFHNASLRKRRKEASEHRENGDSTPENPSHKSVQYPFSVSEKVIIKGNKRTPDKFVGKEAVITSQCLNGWYLLKIIDSGENVRLQYRSLGKIRTSSDREDRCISQGHNSS